VSRLARWITVAVIVSIALAAGSAAALTPQQAAMVSSLKQPLGPVGLAAARAHQRHFVGRSRTSQPALTRPPALGRGPPSRG